MALTSACNAYSSATVLLASGHSASVLRPAVPSAKPEAEIEEALACEDTRADRLQRHSFLWECLCFSPSFELVEGYPAIDRRHVDQSIPNGQDPSMTQRTIRQDAAEWVRSEARFPSRVCRILLHLRS